MAKIRLTALNAEESHPDYAVLRDWLEEHGVDVMWVRVPQDLVVTPTDLVIEEYVHTKEGGIIWNTKEGTPHTRTAKYPRRQRPLPKLTSTEVA